MDSPRRMPTLSFTFLELLDRSFRVYRENFGAFVALSALVIIPITLLQALFSFGYVSSLSGSARFNQSQFTNALYVIGFVVLIMSLIQVVLVNGLLTHMTSEYMFGRRVTIGEAYQAVKGRLSKFGCAIILFYILLIVFAVAITIIGVVCLPLFAGYGLVVYIGIATFACLAPVIILENVDTSFGLNRAWSLGKSRFWKTFGVLIAILVFNYIFNLIFGLVAQFIAFNVLRTNSLVTAQIINLALSTIVTIVLTPLLPVALTLLYYDIRAGVEGLDLALAALDNPLARPMHIESPRPGSFLNNRDVVNVLALVGGGLVLVLLFSATLYALLDQFAPGLSNLQR